MMSTLAFPRPVLRTLGRGTDTRKASARASESVSSRGETLNAGSEGRGDPQIRLGLSEEGTRPCRTVDGRYVCSREDLLEPCCERGDLREEETSVGG